MSSESKNHANIQLLICFYFFCYYSATSSKYKLLVINSFCHDFCQKNKNLAKTIHYLQYLDISVKLTPHFGDIDPPRRKWFKEQIT